MLLNYIAWGTPSYGTMHDQNRSWAFTLHHHDGASEEFVFFIMAALGSPIEFVLTVPTNSIHFGSFETSISASILVYQLSVASRCRLPCSLRSSVNVFTGKNAAGMLFAPFIFTAVN